MIHIDENGNTIYMIATFKLNDADYDKMLPMLRDKIKKYEKINWYFQMKNFEGWTPHAFWRDVMFDLRNLNRLNKVAIVGEKKWHEIMADAMKPFTSAEVRYFDEGNVLIAKEWISKFEA